MKLLKNVNKYIVMIECESDYDFRDMIKFLDIDYIQNCSDSDRKQALIKLKRGVFYISEKKARENNWIL
jgi:hypothetical protein